MTEQEGLMEVASEVPGWILKDRELGPGVLLLTAPLIADKTRAFLDLTSTSRNQVVQWDRLANASRFWSHGERIYVEVALHLWTGNNLPDFAQPYRWASTLNQHNRAPLLRAVGLALGEWLVEEAV